MEEPKTEILEVKNLISSLAEYRNVMIKNLPDDVRANFYIFVKHVNLLHSTKYYDEIRQCINEKFVNANGLIPGTVGAYTMGCMSNNSTPCKVLCAGSAPTNNESTPCDVQVIWALIDDEGFTFYPLNEVESNKANINVSYETIGAFPGFTNDEKQKLNNMGINFVKLVNTDSNNELFENHVPLSNIPTRKVETFVNPESSINTSWLWIIFAFIIIIIVIIVIYYAFMYSGKNNSYFMKY